MATTPQAKRFEKNYDAFFNKVSGQLTTGVRRLMGRAGGNEAVRQIRKRNDAGIDANGKKYKKRSKRYMKAKPRRMKRYNGRFKADTPERYMRLSGSLQRSMSVKNIRTSGLGKTLDIGFTLYIKGKKDQDKLRGLEANGYYPWALSKKGTASRGREDRAILRAMKDVAKINLGAGVIVNR